MWIFEYLQKQFANVSDMREREREMGEELGIFFFFGGQVLPFFLNKKVDFIIIIIIIIFWGSVNFSSVN
jgi:dolichol kinase